MPSIMGNVPPIPAPAQQAATGNPMMQNIMNMMQMAKGNPQVFINSMMQQNPQMAQQLNGLLQGGQSPQQLAMNMLQQRGINPNQIMQMLGHK